MIRDITVGQYYPGQSALHRMDPRIKLILTVAFIVLVLFVGDFIGYGICFAFVLACILIARIPLKYMLKGIKPLWFILIVTFLINIFFTQGATVLFQGTGFFSFIRISWEGVRQALTMAARLILFILISSLLTLTTTPIALTDGLESLLKPLNVIHFPTHELAMMMTIALRFIPTLIEETDKIMKAQKARGADFESGNLFKRAKALVPLLVPLFVSAFRRAEELAMAMEARCYRGGSGRTRLKVLRLTRVDLYSSLVFLLVAGVLIWGVFGWAGIA